MDWRVRALTAGFMTLVMVAMVTLIVTFLNLGFDPGFMRQWGTAFIISWPIAAITGFFVMPTARGLAERVVQGRN